MTSSRTIPEITRVFLHASRDRIDIETPAGTFKAWPTGLAFTRVFNVMACSIVARGNHEDPESPFGGVTLDDMRRFGYPIDALPRNFHENWQDTSRRVKEDGSRRVWKIIDKNGNLTDLSEQAEFGKVMLLANHKHGSDVTRYAVNPKVNPELEDSLRTQIESTMQRTTERRTTTALSPERPSPDTTITQQETSVAQGISSFSSLSDACDSSPRLIARGALDNTLAQSAYGWFVNPDSDVLDHRAASSFRTFVDAYLSVSERFYPLPGDTPTDDDVYEPLISLWQEGAQKMKFAARAKSERASDDIWDAFRVSVSDDTHQWASWIRFQWTPEIAPAFKVRAGDWRTRLSQALERVTPALSAADVGLVSLARHLRAEPHKLHVDPAYRGFGDDRGYDPAVIACAYAWSWHARGASYAQTGIFTRVHELRNSAVSRRTDKSRDYRTIDPVIDWSRIVSDWLVNGVVDRDPSRFCDILRRMRNACQEGQEYHNTIQEIQDSVTPDERVRHMERAISRVVDHADMPNPSGDRTWSKNLRTHAAVTAATRPSRYILLEVIEPDGTLRAADLEDWYRQRRLRERAWKTLQTANNQPTK